MAIYHLTLKTGSRGGGQSASAKSAYICREQKYAPDQKTGLARDPVLASANGNMPSWAESPRDYWAAADQYERANGRLFIEIEYALPVELNQQQREDLAAEFAQQVAGNSQPYQYAIHAGGGTNPHVHLMLSERELDGHDRTPDTWFKRAANKNKLPETGGAKKNRDLKDKRFLENARAQWAELANSHLERAGHAERIDHRTLEAQGIERVATQHIGHNPNAQRAQEAIEHNALAARANAEIARIDDEISAQVDELIEQQERLDMAGPAPTLDSMIDDAVMAGAPAFEPMIDEPMIDEPEVVWPQRLLDLKPEERREISWQLDKNLSELNQAEIDRLAQRLIDRDQVIADERAAEKAATIERICQKYRTPYALEQAKKRLSGQLKKTEDNIDHLRATIERRSQAEPDMASIEKSARRRRNEEFAALPEVKEYQSAKADLEEFERTHPVRNFFGFDGGRAQLVEELEPAVRQAQDDHPDLDQYQQTELRRWRGEQSKAIESAKGKLSKAAEKAQNTKEELESLNQAKPHVEQQSALRERQRASEGERSRSGPSMSR